MDSVQNLFSDIESQAKKDGAQVELVVSNSESFSASYNKGALNKYSFDTSVSAGVRVLYGKGAGFSTTEKISREALLETYKEALLSAQDLNREAKADKAEQTLYKPQGQPLPMNLLSGEIDKLQVPEKLKIAETLERAALQYDSRVQNSPYNGYSEYKSKQYLMSTAGTNLMTESGGVTAFAYALSKSGEDLKSGSASRFLRDPKLLNAEALAHEAAQKSISLLGAVQPKSGKYAVVLSNDVAGKLISFLNDHLSAKQLDEGTSLLKGKLGQKLFSDKITFIDDPFRTELSGARPYDSEGSPSQKITTFENGVLKSYLSNSTLAKKLGIPHTSHATRSGGEMGVSPSNMIVALGDSPLEDLLKAYSQVIMVTSVDALHSGFNETTLEFSLPAYGFLYEGGVLARPLHQMVMSGNLMSALRDVEKVSCRYNDTGNRVLSPDLLIPKMSIAGS